MRLAILGGGGFRTPLVYAALAGSDSGVTDVVLYDTDAGRLDVMAHVLASISSVEGAASARALGYTSTRDSEAPRVTVTTELDAALEGADFVFSAIRVGGLAARVQDERVALEHGVLGQETTGPGGIAYGLRTVPVATRVAERVRAVAPDAWVINFTNPAGMITEAMRGVLGDRVVGICDTPITMAKRAARLLGVDPHTPVGLDYVGLNHLGWLRGLRVDGEDLLPRLLADDALLGATEEGQLFGLDWIREIGALPNEYLYYYDFTRDAVASIRVRWAHPRRVPGRTAGRLLHRGRRGPEPRPRAVDDDPGRAGGDLHGRRARRPGPRRRGGHRRRRRLRGCRARTDAGDRPRRGGHDDPRRREPRHRSRPARRRGRRGTRHRRIGRPHSASGLTADAVPARPDGPGQARRAAHHRGGR